MPYGKRASRASALARILRRKTRRVWREGRDAVAQMATIRQLKDEIALLTTYSSDTVYRLRYASMRYDYISPSVEKLLGYTPQELSRMNFRDLILETRIISEALRPVDSFAPLEDTRRRGAVNKWQADYLIQARDGGTLWVSDISYPWFDAQGSIIGSIGCLRDITERVQAEANAREEIERMVNTDALTGLYTRGMFFTRIEEELRRLRRSHEDMALLLIDIDHFKKINADFGHRTGDLVIKEVARLITDCLRETDIGARIGGEEFGVLLPDTPASGAYWVAERIRGTVSKHIFEFGADEYLLGCTVSVGVAGARFDQDMEANTLYAMADKRLFIAKRTGRDRVSMDEVAEAG